MAGDMSSPTPAPDIDKTGCCFQGDLLQIICIFSGFFAALLAIYVCMRCFLRRRFRTERPLEQSKGSRNPSAVAPLPPSFAGEGTPLDCAICLSATEEGEVVRKLPNCKHVFHVPFIDSWLRSHPTRPMCRVEASRPLPSDIVRVLEALEGP